MPDYIPTGNPEDNMRGIAKQIRDEFLLLQMAVNSKTNKDSVILAATEAQGATVNDYVLTVSPAITAYTTNSSVTFIATHANTGACTIKISALTSKTLKDVDGNPLEAGDIENGSVVSAFYNGADFFLTSGNDKVSRSGDTYTGNHNFTGANITVATQSGGDSSQKAASTAYTQAGLALKANLAYVDAGFALKANINSPAFTGTPTVPNQAQGDNSAKIANTAYVDTGLATKASISYVDSGLAGKATIGYVDSGLALKANINSPTLTGIPRTPTALPGTSGTQIASVDYVNSSMSAASSSGFNVKDFGAKGDGVTDDVAAINATINAANAVGGGTVAFPAGTYMISTSILLKSNVTLWMYGAIVKLINGSAAHSIRIEASASKVGIHGGEIDGNKANCPAGGDGINTFLTGTGTIHLVIRDVYVHDCKQNGIILYGVSAAIPSKYITVNGCRVYNNDLAGIAGDFLEEFAWSNNQAANNATYGIGLGSAGTGKYGVISDNTVSGSGTGHNISIFSGTNRHISVTSNVSKLGGADGIRVGGQDLIVSNNAVYDPVTYGIACSSSAAGSAANVAINGNLVESAGKSGIWLERTSEYSIAGNVVIASTEHGIFVDISGHNGVVSGNTSKSNGLEGIKVQSSNKVSVTGNNLVSNSSNGVLLASSVDCTVVGNVAKSHVFRPYAENGSANFNLVASNNFYGNGVDTPSVPLGVNTVYSNSNLSGGTNSVASAAALTLFTYTDYLVVTGTTTITSIVASWNRRCVTLQFSGILTVTNGSNLRLTSDFVTAANNTLTLVCDGTNWFEVSRSTSSASASGKVLLQTFTAPTTGQIWEIAPTIIDNTYDNYIFEFYNLSATGAGTFTTLALNYYIGGAYPVTNTYYNDGSTGTSSLYFITSAAATTASWMNITGTLTLFMPWNTSINKHGQLTVMTGYTGFTGANANRLERAMNTTQAALTRFKLVMPSPFTFLAGSVGKWYGLK